VDGTPGPIRYARSQGYRIGWQEFGDGPRSLALIWGSPNNIESLWEWPALASYLRGLGRLGLVVHLDQRGVGLSDRVAMSNLPDLDERVADVIAVLDAAGMAEATIMGESEGAACAVRLAATHPERVDRLILAAPTLRGLIPAELRDEMLELIEQNWGEPLMVELQFPSQVADPRFAEWFAKHLRSSASPGEARAMLALDEETDEVDRLRHVHQPTLVLVHEDDPFVPVDELREWVARLPDPTLVVIPGVDRTFGTGVGDEPALDAIADFLGQASGGVAGRDRYARAILFTDIVGSTTHAANVGDGVWRGLLDQHDVVMNRLLRDFGGDSIKSTGDGVVATLGEVSSAVRMARRAQIELEGLGLVLRAGVHTGAIEMRGAEIAGLNVHVASRIADLAGPGEVWVSAEAAAKLEPGLDVQPIGEFELKGVPGAVLLSRLVV
jgi:class 3 adenylate cyclase/pimeloyl-ACP methyl ester carboxylesterase